MRLAGALLLLALTAASQTPPPRQIAPQDAPLLRGALLERDAGADGEFSIRAADNQVIRYRYDAKTYVESDSRMIDVPRLRPGDQIEVISDALSGSMLRYARTVHVIDPTPPPRLLPRTRVHPYRSDDDRLLPHGDLTFSGVVSSLNDGRVVLHTRTGGEQTIVLRKDTRYLDNGELAAAADLKTNMRVFVRGAKDLFGQVEAYQVVWGGILEPVK